MGLMFLLTMLCCAPKNPSGVSEPIPDGAANADGLIGMRFQALPEGLLVEEVQPGMGAEAAGLGPGDLVVAVSGVPAADRPAEDVRAAIVGPAGSTVELTVRSPIHQEERMVLVQRGIPPQRSPAPRSTPPRPPPEVQAFTHALRHEGTEAVTTAATGLLGVDLNGQSLGEAVHGSLRLVAQERPENVHTALSVLDEAGASDWYYQRTRGEVLQIMSQPEAAAAAFAAADALRPPDHQSQQGVQSDLGGDPRGRKMWIEASWDAGQQQQAADRARALLRTGVHSPSLLNRLSMAPLDPGDTWSATLPTMPDFTVALLDGEPWQLSEQQGRVVVLTFWATWCGPCRKEMPELQALWSERQGEDVSFLAISTDDPADTEAVQAKVAEFGLTFPVTHHPSLGDDYNVSGIPAIRVLNRDGALHYAAKGYSASSVERLNEQISAALAQSNQQAPLGDAWSVDGSASLQQFLPIMGADGIWHRDGRTVVGLHGAAPMVFTDTLPQRAEVNVDGIDPQTSALLTWLDGPIASTARSRVIRAWDPTGAQRWLQTTPAPIVDIAAVGDQLWVATREQIHVLHADGTWLESVALSVSDLAEGDGGVWAVGDDTVWWLQPGTDPVAHGRAPDGIHVDGMGGFASGIATDVITGRFGADQTPRMVAVRSDNTIIATDSSGQVAFTWALSQPAQIAAGDMDGDGQDELLVSISRQGVAVVSLSLP